MRTPKAQHSTRRESIYTLAFIVGVGFLMLTTLHDDRLSLDRKCTNYASEKACRVF